MESENYEKELDTESYLTTTDNPWNPQTQFDEWYRFDNDMGYFTTQRLAKMEDYLVKTLKTDDPSLISDMAILELVRLDPLKRYTVVHLKKRDPGVVELTEDQRAQLELAKSLK
ncbi:MAG: hypothetical protein J5617_03645 [Bacilli bacterium]|nr:hypothetical protein [Bacilli bacterium]